MVLKLTASQLRVLRLMCDGWTLIDNDDVTCRIVSPDAESEKVSRSIASVLEDQHCIAVKHEWVDGLNATWTYKLTARGREAAGAGT